MRILQGRSQTPIREGQKQPKTNPQRKPKIKLRGIRISKEDHPHRSKNPEGSKISSKEVRKPKEDKRILKDVRRSQKPERSPNKL